MIRGNIFLFWHFSAHSVSKNARKPPPCASITEQNARVHFNNQPTAASKLTQSKSAQHSARTARKNSKLFVYM